MKDKIFYDAKLVDKNDKVLKAMSNVISWIGASQSKTKEFNFKKPTSKFIISAYDDYSDIISLILNTKFSPVEIIIDERVSKQNIANLEKLASKYPSHFTIYKTSRIIGESYFKVEGNLFISSTSNQRNYQMKEETAITNAGKLMLKDFESMYEDYKQHSAKLEKKTPLEM